MLFGERARFGIEYDLGINSDDEWMYGRACYSIGSKQVGDYARGTSLRDLLFQWERISCDAGKRSNPRLALLDASDLVRTISRGMYGNDSDDGLTELAIEEQWAHFYVSPEIDIFDGCHVVLVENNTIGRCISLNWKTDSVYECVLEQGEFDRVLASAIKPLLKHYKDVSGLD